MTRRPIRREGFLDRCLLRALARLARRRVLLIRGIENLRTQNDPFILALNHNSYSEAVLVPAMLILHRGGQLIHFLADWNYRLIPGVGLIYHRAQTITVTRKSARPKFFNVFKPLHLHRLSAFERSRAHLIAGRSVGVFPEGKINRHPRWLLAGRRGAARLSLETGTPVVPAGIRYPGVKPGRLVADGDAMEVHIGAPLFPPTIQAGGWAPLRDVNAWHATVMNAIAQLSGKTWIPQRRELEPWLSTTA